MHGGSERRPTRRNLAGGPGHGRLRTWRLPLSPRLTLRRVVEGGVAVGVIVTTVFVFLQLTGDPTRTVAPLDSTEEELDRIAAAYGFDQPLLTQYATFVRNVLTGHFPDSVAYGIPAMDVVRAGIGPTVLLAVSAMVLGNVLGLLIGYVSCMSASPVARRIPILLSVAGTSLPAFFVGIILVLVFAVTLDALPASGYGGAEHLVLPLITLTLGVMPSTARVFRAQLLEVLDQDHVVLARAKGLPRGRVNRRHVAFNALGPAVSLIGLQLGGLLAGAVTVEVIFRWPGVGSIVMAAIGGRDYAVVLAAAVLIAVGYVVASFLADVAAQLIDPRAGIRR